MNNSDKYIDKLRQIVLDNLHNEQFGVSELARVAGISRSHLHRKLSLIRKQTASQFIREVRLKQAFKILTEGDITVSEVTYNVGFGNPSYFNNCFHAYYGYSPGEAMKTEITSEGRGNYSYSIKAGYSIKKVTIQYGILFLVVCIIFASFIINRRDKEAVLERSIAVLPFDNLSNNVENQYFADGLVELLLKKTDNRIFKARYFALGWACE